MSYTLRQVQPLLTKPELELFHASRAGAVKELTARQLAGKITRARALRDKYRDTFRRQTVATRTGAARVHQQMGGENSRTEIKADIMQELLSRFEAQSEKVQARQAKEAARKTGAVRAPRASGPSVTGAKPASTRSGSASAQPEVNAPAKRAATRKAATKTAAAKKAPAKKPAARSAITGAAKPAAKLVKQVRQAVAKQAAQAPAEGTPRARKGSRRTVVGGSASDLAQGAVPTGMPAAARRGNPLKAEPVNKKIHASARGRQKVHTAKRDGR